MRYAIGLDIGVTNVKAVGVTPAGEVLFRRTFETHSESPDWPGRVKMQLGEMERERGGAEWVGVAAPGVARADGRSIRWMRGRLAEVQGLDWSEYFGRTDRMASGAKNGPTQPCETDKNVCPTVDKSGCPTVPVLNDAQAALLGEVWLGAARGGRNVVLLTLGTGVGGAAMVDGRLLRGHLGRAGHLGHICLDMEGERDIVNVPGSLEVMIGNYSIGTRSGGRFRNTHEVVEAFRRGDAEAKVVWERSIEALACGVVSVVNVLDPEVVIVGGGIAVAGDALFGPLEKRVRELEWSLEGEHVRIVPADLGEFAGAMGAAWQAMEEGSGFRVQGSGLGE